MSLVIIVFFVCRVDAFTIYAATKIKVIYIALGLKIKYIQYSRNLGAAAILHLTSSYIKYDIRLKIYYADSSARIYGNKIYFYIQKREEGNGRDFPVERPRKYTGTTKILFFFFFFFYR